MVTRSEQEGASPALPSSPQTEPLADCPVYLCAPTNYHHFGVPLVDSWLVAHAQQFQQCTIAVLTS